MVPSPPWYVRVRDGFLRFWRNPNPRVAAFRDILVAGLVVLLLLGVVWAYTGQPFPSQAPLVVVESGSMMHGALSPCGSEVGCEHRYGSPSFGRVGTIDPGDLVLVKAIDNPGDVETAFEPGAENHYGGPGDVLIFRRGDGVGGTPIIHRAMLYIEAVPNPCLPNGDDAATACKYRIRETCGDNFDDYLAERQNQSNWSAYCDDAGSSQPITLSLQRDGVFLILVNYPQNCTFAPASVWFHSGFITKGDNNQIQDPPYLGRTASGAGTCGPVPEEGIIGQARGEIPWFGLIKLAIYGNKKNYGDHSDPTGANQGTFLNARAPWDIWVSLVIAIGVLIALPITVDFAIGRARRAIKKRRERQTATAAPPKPPPEAEAPPPKPPTAP